MNAPRWLRAWLWGLACRVCGRRPLLGTDAACRCSRWTRWGARGKAYGTWVGTRAGWGS